MTEEKSRHCKMCGKTKSVSEFYHRKNGYPRYQCKDCEKLYNRRMLQARKSIPAIYKEWCRKQNNIRKARRLRRIMEKHGNSV